MTRWLDRRPAVTRVVQSWRHRTVGDPWSLLLGQVAIASFIVCSVTGVFLMFFFDPSTAPVIYDGAYGPLRGLEVSQAFASTMDLSFEVRGGLLMRQLHHWSATVMIATLMLHILRVFFTGGFRKPRELSWVLVFGILLTSMAAGLTGHVLPDDLLSGTSLAVLDGLLKGIPLVGTWLSYLVFQGRFPSGALETLYLLHVAVLPAAIVLIMIINGWLGLRQRPASERGSARPAPDVVVRPLRVEVAARAGLLLVVSGVLTLLATTVTVNPVWLYGPADAAAVSAGGSALWYLAFLDGAQRLVPPGWEFVLFDRTWTPAILVPVGVCVLFLLAAMVYPFVERWLTGDNRGHHVLTRPRHAPTRTGIGVAGIVFYGVLWAAGGSDVIAMHLSLSNEALVRVLQAALVLGPVAAFMITKRICLGLQRRDRDVLLHGHETGRIIRMPDGAYVEVHRPITAYERRKLLDVEVLDPLTATRDVHGHTHWRGRARAGLSRWFLQDRVLPATRAELEAQRTNSSMASTSTSGRSTGISV